MSYLLAEICTTNAAKNKFHFTLTIMSCLLAHTCTTNAAKTKFIFLGGLWCHIYWHMCVQLMLLKPSSVEDENGNTFSVLICPTNAAKVQFHL